MTKLVLLFAVSIVAFNLLSMYPKDAFANTTIPLNHASCVTIFFPVVGFWDSSTNTCTLSPVDSQSGAGSLIGHADIASGETLQIDSGTELFITGTNGNSFTLFNDCTFGEDCASISNQGTILIGNQATLNDAAPGVFGGNGAGITNTGSIEIQNGGNINNDGYILNNPNGLITNDLGGTISINSPSGTLNNNGGTVNDYGTVNTGGNFIISSPFNVILDSSTCASTLSGTWDSQSSTCTIPNGKSGSINPGFTLMIPSGNSLVVVGGLGNSGNIENNGVLENERTLLNGGTINNFGTFTNTGTVTEEYGGTINNSGTVNNSNAIVLIYGGLIHNNSGGVIHNSGAGTISSSLGSTIFNNSGATIYNSGGTIGNYYDFINSGTIFNSGTIINNFIFNNKGTVYMLGTLAGNQFLNSGSIINSFTIADQNSCQDLGGIFTGTTCDVLDLTIGSGSTLSIAPSIKVTIVVIADNLGTINIAGGTINNLGLLTNSGTVNNSGAINNLRTINNSGAINNNCGATIIGTISGNAPINTCHTTPPTLSISSPDNNTDTSSNTATVSGTASDDITIPTISWKLDDGSVSTVSGITPADAINWSFNTGTMQNGFHIIQINATDSAGLVAEKHLGITVNAVHVTTTAALSGTAGANGWFKSQVSVTLTASDNGGGDGIKSTSYSLDGAPQTTYSGQFTITGDSNHTLTFNSTDNAGNVESPNTMHIAIDTTSPTVTGTANMTANSNGWYNHPLQVSWAGTDTTSGIASCNSPTIYSGPDGSSVSIAGHCTDNAGNVGTSTMTIKYDSTPPVITSIPATQPNSNGWFNSNVVIQFVCSDATSSISICTSNQIVSMEGEDQQVIGTATDNAGNSASITASGINIDKTAPVTTATPSGTLGNNGWYRSVVSVTLAATDNLSGVAFTSYTLDSSAQTSYTGPISVTGNGTHALTFNSTDKAGNVESVNTVSIKIDNVPPTVTGTANMTANSNGWYNHPLQVSWAGTDTTSGIASCNSPTIYSGPDGSSVSIAGHCTDNAGNVGTSTMTIKYDSTPPIVVVPANIATVFPTSPAGAVVTFSDTNDTAASATDATSGVTTVTYSPSSGSTFPIGTTTVTVTAADNAGNEATGTFTVTVLSPAQAIQKLIDEIGSMNLDHGIANSLDAKLTAANSSLNSGNDNTAENQLEAFINEVNAQTGKKIAEATQLIAAAQNIINSIH